MACLGLLREHRLVSLENLVAGCSSFRCVCVYCVIMTEIVPLSLGVVSAEYGSSCTNSFKVNHTEVGAERLCRKMKRSSAESAIMVVILAMKSEMVT